MPSDETEAIVAANDAFYTAFNARDLGAMRDLWARGQPVSCVHPGWNVLTGHDEVMASWEAILTNPSQPKVMSGGASVIPAGDLAIVICREIVSGSPIATTNIFAREDGRWRMVHHHASPVLTNAG